MFYFFFRKPYWQISSIFFSLHDLLIVFMAIMLSSAAAIQKKHFVLRTEHSVLFFACLFVCAEIYNPGAKDVVDIPPPPMPMIAPPPIPPPSAPAIDELIQQSQWNLQQQEQHLHTLRQVKWKKCNEKSISFPPGTFIPVYWLLMNVFVLKSVFAECFSCPELIGEFFCEGKTISVLHI